MGEVEPFWFHNSDRLRAFYWEKWLKYILCTYDMSGDFDEYNKDVLHFRVASACLAVVLLFVTSRGPSSQSCRTTCFDARFTTDVAGRIINWCWHHRSSMGSVCSRCSTPKGQVLPPRFTSQWLPSVIFCGTNEEKTNSAYVWGAFDELNETNKAFCGGSFLSGRGFTVRDLSWRQQPVMLHGLLCRAVYRCCCRAYQLVVAIQQPVSLVFAANVRHRWVRFSLSDSHQWSPSSISEEKIMSKNIFHHGWGCLMSTTQSLNIRIVSIIQFN